jgi:hypothetical protein
MAFIGDLILALYNIQTVVAAAQATASANNAKAVLQVTAAQVALEAAQANQDTVAAQGIAAVSVAQNPGAAAAVLAGLKALPPKVDGTPNRAAAVQAPDGNFIVAVLDPLASQGFDLYFPLQPSTIVNLDLIHPTS